MLFVLVVLGLWACGGPGAADRHARAETPPAYVDSVVAWDVALARFREGLTEPTGLSGGAASRDALIRAFVTGLERADTAGLAGLMLDRAEFAYFYYPTVPEAHPPYDLSPSLMWFMIQAASRKGLLRALGDLGGASLGFAGYACEGTVSRQGDNAVWGSCLLHRVQAPGDTVTERLFGPIVERDGRYKFVSLANKR